MRNWGGVILVVCFMAALLALPLLMLYAGERNSPWLVWLRQEHSLSEYCSLALSWLRWIGELGWTALMLFIVFLLFNGWWFLCRVAHAEADLVPKSVKPARSPIPKPDEIPLEGD